MTAVLAMDAGCAIAGPAAERWPRFERADASSTRSVDYAPWARFLATYLVVGEDGINRIA